MRTCRAAMQKGHLNSKKKPKKHATAMHHYHSSVLRATRNFKILLLTNASWETTLTTRRAYIGRINNRATYPCIEIEWSMRTLSSLKCASEAWFLLEDAEGSTQDGIIKVNQSAVDNFWMWKCLIPKEAACKVSPNSITWGWTALLLRSM